jgi:hypothetical protein
MTDQSIDLIGCSASNFAGFAHAHCFSPSAFSTGPGLPGLVGVGHRQRENGGAFRVDEQGFGMISVIAQRPFTAYQRVGITEEPAGGSPGPTSPRVIGATLQGF